MSLITKKINQIMKWENVELSVREMADVIQKELLEVCSDKDLTELEKGMKKSWILGVGAPNRYYPSAYQDIKLQLRYNTLLHTIQEITLQDSINKKEYFIPRGKKYCDQLRHTVMRRIENEKERRKKSSRNPARRINREDLPLINPVLPRDQSASKLTYCRSCGSEIGANGLFCSICGQSISQERPKRMHTASGKKGKYRRKQKSRIKPVLCIVAVAILCIGIFGIVLPLLKSSETGTNTNEIAIVQNGYLGEYTDIPVKIILDNYYGMMYENEEWDSGETDSGSVIVQARYFDEGMENDATTIQFTMLNEECFKISAFVDPLNPVKKATDLLAAMNYNYFLAYMAENRSVAGDPAAEREFVAKLDQISGSAVQYGASAEYSGNRAVICEIDRQIPLDVSVAMLLDNYGLLDMSYYSETDPLEQTYSTEPEETENTTHATDPEGTGNNTCTTEPPEVEYNADEMLLAVLNSEIPFIMSDTYENVFLNSVKRLGDYEFVSPLIPVLYAYADMDEDGQREVIVELTSNVDGWRLVLRYQDGAVYGYGFSFRGLKRISISGLAGGSSGAAYSDVFRLRFNYGEVKEEYLSSVETENALNNWIEVEWYDYNAIHSDNTSPEELAGEYPLDFIGYNTEAVVNALGENFIYEDGFAGSKLFYYGNEPDVHFGFVPYDWGNPVLTGNEPISIILLSGDAQINEYLSADMNKSEIDAVAWATPNVISASNSSTYDMMSGNTYFYRIETNAAIITYTWYLDNGDSIEYAASEVVICPK